jgi:hypothetical protein
MEVMLYMYTVRPHYETGLGAQLQYPLHKLPALEVKLAFFNFGIPVITCIIFLQLLKCLTTVTQEENFRLSADHQE